MAPSELEQAVATWVRSRHDAMPELEARAGHTPDEDLAYFQDQIAKRCQVWVAAEGTAILAIMALREEQLVHLYVDPSAQEQGIGTALLDKAKELMPRGFTLFTHKRNHRARTFYVRRGLRAVAFGVSPPPESEPDVKYRWDPDAE